MFLPLLSCLKLYLKKNEASLLVYFPSSLKSQDL